jgi:hypothetical protein
MRTGRPIAPLSVTAEERERLQEWARRPKTAQALAVRSRIVLECAVGQPNTVVAGKLGMELPRFARRCWACGKSLVLVIPLVIDRSGF